MNAGATESGGRPSSFRIVFGIYLLALVASWGVLATSSDRARPRPEREERVATLLEATSDEHGGADRPRVEMVYRDLGPREVPAIVLIHGSPGSLQDFQALANALAGEWRVIVPDLPGFGRSQRFVSDYSARAHARYLIALLDSLGVENVHLVAFSMGGAVALEFVDLARERVKSVAMVAALGVVEHELFGDPQLNHLVHGAQLAALEILRFAVPHFGALDRVALDVPYARNFFDTDQSRLRSILERVEPPVLILHGERDFLVPISAAREHHRIVPQSELIERNGNHFLLWTESQWVAETLAGFVARVERGDAVSRREATPERVAAAAAPAVTQVPRTLFTEVLLAVLLAIATFVSEDLTCVGAGLLIASERMSPTFAIAGALIGIFVGDVGLFLVGRAFVHPLVRGRIGRRFVSEAALERGRDWLARHDGKAILMARFMPGLRLPTYLAAGALGMPLLRFSALFLLAACLWTPLLVLGAAWAGEPALRLAQHLGAFGPWLLLLAAVAIVLLLRVVVALFTWRGRRRLLGRFRKWTQFEFWPPWLFYPPVIAKLIALAFRHRGFGTVTAVNPGIEHGGFVGESKFRILRNLEGAGTAIARSDLVLAAWSEEERVAFVRGFMQRFALEFPIVLKPDVGQRGSGVQILRDDASMRRFLAHEMVLDHVVQEYVPGVEFGIFYVRDPDHPSGHLLSLTEKRMPAVIGDGVSTLERLILADERAVTIADTYFERNRDRLTVVPEVGESCRLVELGTHCRGAIFLDGRAIETPELVREIDRIARAFDGFYFGRFDIRARDVECFRAGRDLKVIELNGVTAEATHIYDPKCSLREAYRVLFEQWDLAFTIGSKLRARGARTTSLVELLREFQRYRRGQRSHAKN